MRTATAFYSRADMSSRHGRTWAVTSYFNPMGFRRRRKNFAAFRDALGVPLLAVELARPGRHRLARSDADIVLHIAGNDLIWQKERLLNIAIAVLPPEAETVAWLDCDVLFEQPDWAEAASDALGRGARYVQPFSEVEHLGPRGDREVLFAERGIAAAYLTHGRRALDGDLRELDQLRGEAPARTISVIQGLGWVARREIIGAVGLYDGHIIGGGDTPAAYAFLGLALPRARRPISPAHYQHVSAWSERLRANYGGRVDHVPGTLRHLWHGDMKDRRYDARHRRLAELGYDPRRDLRPGPEGAWELADPEGPIARLLARYFALRNEDGALSDVSLESL